MREVIARLERALRAWRVDAARRITTLNWRVRGWLLLLLAPEGRRERRYALAGASALLILALSASLVAATRQPTPGRIAQRPATPTATLAATATGTPTLAPTPTDTPVPVAYVKAVPTTPPPPPVPTAPPMTPTVTYCTPTPVPTATATATAAPTATGTTAPTATGTSPTATASVAPAAAARMAGACVPCPYYAGNNPAQSAIRAALNAAADSYHLPRNLLLAVAWQESKWHEDVTSCDGGIGLMQLQYYTWPWLNTVSEPGCGLAASNDDPHTLQGNANLGAKYLVYVSCYYSYYGDSAGTLKAPAKYTVDWYYQQAGLQYPDSMNAQGTPTTATSLCAAIFNDPNHPEYPDMPSTIAQPWPCPYSARVNDTTLLDITLSAYNQGPAYTSQCGICNPWYVAAVEGFIPRFASGALPTAPTPTP
ncbi:MAG TPA: transglycosylase SLT domain-containing protein [Ktedonobacterales bacterium]